MPIGLWAWMGPRNHVLGGSKSPMVRGNFGGKGRPLWSIGTFSMSCAETAEPIDLPFELWIRVGQRKHEFSRIHQMAPICTISVVKHWWWIRLSHPSAAVIRSYVKLLWPLIIGCPCLSKSLKSYKNENFSTLLRIVLILFVFAFTTWCCCTVHAV